MKVHCSFLGIEIEPENYQDKLFLAQYTLDLVESYGGIGKIPSNIDIDTKVGHINSYFQNMEKDDAEYPQEYELAEAIDSIMFQASPL